MLSVYIEFKLSTIKQQLLLLYGQLDADWFIEQ